MTLSRQNYLYTHLRQVTLLVISLFITTSASAGLINPTNIVTFGDSLSDNGNFFALTGGTVPPPPYYNGRFSNGPVWVERYAANKGATLDNRAVGGATTGTANTNGAFPGMTTQINTYVTGLGGGFVPDAANTMFTIWGGANDFLSLGPLDNPIVALSNAVTNIVTGVGTLAASGAQHFIVMGLPDLGLTPRSLADDILDPGSAAGATAISQAFNDTLVAQLAINFTGLDYTFIDTFFLLQDAVNNPGDFGFTNVTQQCFDASVPSLCSNPDEYVFWDEIHPTSATHGLIAAQLVPIPGAVWLFASALGLLGWSRRRAA